MANSLIQWAVFLSSTVLMILASWRPGSLLRSAHNNAEHRPRAGEAAIFQSNAQPS